MSAEFEKYADAKENFEKTSKKLKQIINLLKNASSALASIENVTMSNCKFGSPPSPGGPTINANEWPSAETIGKLIDDYHKYKIEMKNTHSRLSDREKDSIKLPAFLSLH